MLFRSVLVIYFGFQIWDVQGLLVLTKKKNLTHVSGVLVN